MNKIDIENWDTWENELASTFDNSSNNIQVFTDCVEDGLLLTANIIWQDKGSTKLNTATFASLNDGTNWVCYKYCAAKDTDMIRAFNEVLSEGFYQRHYGCSVIIMSCDNAENYNCIAIKP